MPDYLDVLAKNAMRLIKERYYATNLERAAPAVSLKESIPRCRRTPILSEIKFASPSTRDLTKEHDLKRIAKDMEDGGVVGISVLAEPRHFGGHIGYVA